MFKPEVRPVVFGRCMVRLLPKPFKTQTAILSFKISVVGSIPIFCANSKCRSNGRSIFLKVSCYNGVSVRKGKLTFLTFYDIIEVRKGGISYGN